MLFFFDRDHEKESARQAVEVQFNVVHNFQVIHLTTLTFSNFELLFLRNDGEKELVKCPFVCFVECSLREGF